MNELAITQIDEEVSPAFEQIVSHMEGRLGSAQRRGRLIGVTGCARGVGASYSARALAKNLGRNGKRILLADGRSLLAACREHSGDLLSHCLFTDEPRVMRLAKTRHATTPRGVVDGGLKRKLEALWEELDCVLLDLGAVTASGDLARFAPDLDDLLLVVAAGETQRTQIAYARRLIAHAGGTLTGCILNKRTYPLPERLYRALYS